MLVITVALYSPVARHDFIDYDDSLYVKKPIIARGLSWEGVLWSFGVGPGRQYFHPVTWASHMIDAQLFGPDRPGASHLVSAALHAVASVLLLIALWKLTGSLWPSAGTAALFAWHPLHVESVAWFAERKDVISGIFFFLTLWSYASYAKREPSAWRYGLVLLTSALALASKPTVVTLPCVLLLLDFWPLNRASRAAIKRIVLEKLPILAMSIAVSIAGYRIQVYDQGLGLQNVLPLSVRLGNAIVSYARYLNNTIVPIKLAVFYPYQVWSAWQIAGAAAILIAITALAVAQRRRRPFILLGWLWFLGMLVPMIGLVQSGLQSMADRYTYLPLIGIFITVCWTIDDWLRRDLTRRLPIVCAGAGIVLTIFAGLTAYQLHFWKDDYTLFSRALVTTNDNWFAHGHIAKRLAERGDEPAALAHYEESIRINPHNAEVRYNLGNTYLRDDRIDDGIAQFRAAIDIRPDWADAHNNLGVALASKADFAAAEEQFRAALAIEPQRDDIRRNLAAVLVKQGKSG